MKMEYTENQIQENLKALEEGKEHLMTLPLSVLRKEKYQQFKKALKKPYKKTYNKIYNKAYYQKNKSSYKAYNKKYYQDNKDKWKAYHQKNNDTKKSINAKGH